jgi:hypothetical protein
LYYWPKQDIDTRWVALAEWMFAMTTPKSKLKFNNKVYYFRKKYKKGWEQEKSRIE